MAQPAWHETIDDLAPPEVIRRAQAGDREAQEELLEACYDYVRRVLYRIAGPGPDLEDLQQTALCTILTSLGGFRFESPFRAWARGVCVNTLRGAIRKRKVRRIMITLENPEDLTTDTSSQRDVNLGEGALDARRGLVHLRELLERLPETQRTALVLRTVYGHSVEEVASLMDAGHNTTRIRLYLARKALLRLSRKVATPKKSQS